MLEKEPCTRVVIRLAWNLLSRLQMVEIAKMLLVGSLNLNQTAHSLNPLTSFFFLFAQHEMIHAFLGLAIGDFVSRFCCSTFSHSLCALIYTLFLL